MSCKIYRTCYQLKHKIDQFLYLITNILRTNPGHKIIIFLISTRSIDYLLNLIFFFILFLTPLKSKRGSTFFLLLLHLVDVLRFVG